MAEAPDTSDKRLEELEARATTCRPSCCPAIATTVGRVSRNWRNAIEGGPLPIPSVARRPLPPGGVEELQGAFFVERIKDLFCKMAKAEGKMEAVCEHCAGAKSVAFCRQCTEFICSNCVFSHKKLKVFTGHIVEDLKRGGAKSIPFEEVLPPSALITTSR